MVYPLKIPDRLCCDRCFLYGLILRQCIDEITANMSHATAVLYTGTVNTCELLEIGRVEKEWAVANCGEV